MYPCLSQCSTLTALSSTSYLKELPDVDTPTWAHLSTSAIVTPPINCHPKLSAIDCWINHQYARTSPSSFSLHPSLHSN